MIAVNASTSLPGQPTRAGKSGLLLRPASAADRTQISDLIFFESRVHRHLDWRPPLEWLGSSPYWIIEERGRIAAALACPPDPPGVAWIRLFAFASPLSGPSAWAPLWDAARGELAAGPGATAAAIIVHGWFVPLLRDGGFRLRQTILLLAREGGSPAASPAGLDLRAMTAEDLPLVAEVDAAAFEPLWHNSLPALQKAWSQALFASVARDASGVIGYQISTENPHGAHLARLAVRPEAQGRGVASALVAGLLDSIHRRGGPSRLTVNTQADNRASLAVYRRFGFRPTGEQYPVYVCEVPEGA